MPDPNPWMQIRNLHPRMIELNLDSRIRDRHAPRAASRISTPADSASAMVAEGGRISLHPRSAAAAAPPPALGNVQAQQGLAERGLRGGQIGAHGTSA